MHAGGRPERPGLERQLMKHSHMPQSARMAPGGLSDYRSIDKSKLKLTMAITGTVMVLEVIGGLWTNSLALLSDAGHMFTHFFALAISLGAILYADKETCHHRTFGFYRAEILSALLNSLFLFAVTGWILVEGFKRILHPAPILGLPMFLIAIVGLIVNLLSAWILHGASRDDLNIKGAFVHMLADSVSSVAIVIGAVVIYFTKWTVIDPILSICIALVIFSWGWGLLKDSVNILLESAPKGITTDDVGEALRKGIPQIKNITDMHIWEITSRMYSMTVQITLKQELPKAREREISKKIRQIVSGQFDIGHVTIEIE